MFKRIVVAVDGSKHANRAAAYAIELAELSSGRLTLIHVIAGDASTHVPPHLRSFDRIEHASKTQEDAFRDAATEILEEARATVAEHDVNVDTCIEIGQPAYAIVKKAESLDADLIVIGSRGLSDLKGFLLGSVSHRVAQQANCPVLLVR